MKTVGNTSFVIEAWLAQRQKFAGTPQNKPGLGSWGQPGYNGRRMFFEEQTIYSYGHHFPIARLIGNNRVLFTAQEYSATTRNHKYQVEAALLRADLEVFIVDNPEQPPCPERAKLNYQEAFAKAMRARETLVSINGDQRYRAYEVFRARLAYRAFCRTFGMPIAWEPTKEQWKAYALRYKKYWTLVKITRPLARRLQGKAA